MNGSLFLLPLISAGLGWCIHRVALWRLFYPIQPRKIAGIRFQGLLPARQEQLAAKVAHLAGTHLLDPGMLEAAASNPAHFKKLLPVIEEQVDHFLRVKLKASMPVVGMLIGDKTINQLKGIFVAELENIFPVVMKNYAANMAAELDVPAMIREKISAIPQETLVKGVKESMKTEGNALLWLGAVSGFFTGVLGLLLIWCLR